MRDELKLQRTKDLAEESSFIKISGKAVKVGASLYQGNKYVSSAVNSNKTNPKVVKYNSVLPFEKVPFLHAEMAALISASKKINFKDFKYCSLYIARKLNCGDYGLARPCKACMEAIKEYGIKRIVYTTESGYAVEYISGE